ncbi:MAG: Uma2 family endonuclease, partial [Dehalococcoidia bacterium]
MNSAQRSTITASQVSTFRTSYVLEEEDYPDGDGEPWAENDLHRREITRLIEALDAYVPWYVSGTNFIYYEQDNLAAVFSPDVYVVNGVAKGDRRVYFLWEEGILPQVVVEITSRSTRNKDLNDKRVLYARLGIAEYYLYDPYGQWLRPRFLGYRLGSRGYEPMIKTPAGELFSDALGLRLVLENERLQLYKRVGGQRLLSMA